MSEERRQGNSELSEKVTRLTTLFEENFDRDNGHFTVIMRDMKKKVDSHDTDIKRAKWTIGLSTPFVLAGIAWLKSKVMGSN